VTTDLMPRKSETDLKPVIGISPPPKTWLVKKGDANFAPCIAGTPAAEAGFEFGDVIIATTDPDDPAQLKGYRADRIKDLPDDPRFPNHGQRDYFEFSRRMQLLADKEIIVRVERTHKDKTEKVDLKIMPIHRLNLGARMQMGPVQVVREGSPADGHVLPPSTQADKKRRGDIIEAVSVREADGSTLRFQLDTKNKGAEKDKVVIKPLDPERLPLELRKWSDRLDQAEYKGEREVTLELSRQREGGGPEVQKVTETVKWDTTRRFDRVVPLSLNSGLAIPELGIAYQVKTIVADATKDSALQVGDVILNLRYDVEAYPDELPWLRQMINQVFGLSPPAPEARIPWMKKDLEEGQWAVVSFKAFQDDQPLRFKKLVLRVMRDKKTEEIEIPIQTDETWALADRGWLLARDSRRVVASGPLDAVWMGLKDTNNRMFEVFQNLRGMIMNRISFKNLGGPLTIAYGTYRFASMDFADLVFFLGLISINLAVVNFLPIPILDGGHMVFLIYEKIRGQPASEMVRVYATYVGLAMILCLMGFVLWLDVSRLFF
jgi:regulator of sigma E protease